MAVTSSVRRALVALLALAWLAFAAPVAAHAELEATSPEAGSTVASPPQEVAARFSEPLVGESSFDLVGPNGQTAATGRIDPADSTRLVAQLPDGVAPGQYEVQWRAFSADGHLERGTFAFTVAEPTPLPPTPTPRPSVAPTSAPSPSPTPAPSDVPLPSPSAASSPGPTSGSDVLIPIFIALVALAVLAGWLLRARGAPRR